MRSIHVTILTDRRYVDPKVDNPYIRNLLKEDLMVRRSLEKKGLRIERCSWDDQEFDWSETESVLFRSTWDYFDRFPEFSVWLERVRNRTRLVNPYPVIRWNLDKHYLEDLSAAGVNIPPTRFIEKEDPGTLAKWVETSGWREIILKPVISGAARHTHRILPGNAGSYESLFRRLIKEESMMIQEFQEQVPLRGEVAFMVFGGQYTHAVIKKARKGDFRVQDDFGGTVQPYHPSRNEIRFAEEVVARCGFDPVYARVDAIWDNAGNMAVSELELIEPELWFRFHPGAADRLAEIMTSRFF